MSSVERNESGGYVVTITEEEARPLMTYWPATATAWCTDLSRVGQAIADGLRACQPPPPPRPGDVVQQNYGMNLPGTVIAVDDAGVWVAWSDRPAIAHWWTREGFLHDVRIGGGA